MKRMRNVAKSGWRRRYLTTAALAVAAMFAFCVASALGDAGNPILGTIRGTIVPDASGPGVTVYVRGQWNWLSHNSDCNFDRAATGVGIIWNDPNSPGFTVTKGSITAGVGVKSSTDGNAVDQMVHPVDRGNQVEGYTSSTWTSTAQGYPAPDTAGDYPSGQQFADPTSNNPNDYKLWKGGCGREPLTATLSKDNNPESTGNSCGTTPATTTCSGHPWGSWGYEKNGGRGYSHHYASLADLTTVCVNFYDVHGGGKFNSGKFQLVNGAKEITVNGNGDNSIQTNAFNTAQGANCFSFARTPTETTTAQSILPNDTGTVTGNNPGGTLTFKLFAPNSDGTPNSNCSGTAAYTQVVNLPSTTADSKTVSTTNTGTFASTPGQWTWQLIYSGDTDRNPPKTVCGTEKFTIKNT